ncbi:hypothetical protein BDV96DRAFT_639790 [Lophiotrema nucula]|uniref:Uncharacterized protein n=1 Tax=Lophiotrema nucula TaxID=690887 RepID=A0A6A5ZY61_9PLEO|nr:hypothetical protein BDV96DRAFT_639790 [Lophiotrema nucula]
MSRNPIEPILPDKECYYDEAAREKPALRAKRASERDGKLPAPVLPPLRTIRLSDTTEEEEAALARESETALQERLSDPKWHPLPAYRPFEWLSEPEHYANELWKSQVLEKIYPIIAAYEQKDASLLIRPARIPLQKCSSIAALRLFQTPELVEIILRFADSQTQIVACQVAHECRRLRKKGQSYEHLLPTYGAPASPSQPSPLTLEWKDLTQFQINPYLIGCIESYVGGPPPTLEHGRMEIGIPADYEDIGLCAHTDPLNLRSMFITQPPCKCLRFYVWSTLNLDASDWASLYDVGAVINENGICIEDFFTGLRQYAPAAVDAWLQNVHVLRKWIANGHWKHDVWGVGHMPSLVVLLSQPEIDPDMDCNGYDMRQWEQAVYQEPRSQRQRLWMSEDEMKPPRPTSTESEVLPGIYSIGLTGPIFQDKLPSPRSRRSGYKKVFEKILAEYADEPEAGEEQV